MHEIKFDGYRLNVYRGAGLRGVRRQDWSGMTRRAKTQVLIIGGGASGVLLACHLLRDPDSDVSVTLIEKRADIGRGIAYGTANPDHLLNVRAAFMSAFPDDPQHFWRWLSTSGEGDRLNCPDPFCFVSRRVYGRYIASLIEPLTEQRSGRPRLRVIRGECVSITDRPSGVSVTLADGSSHAANVLVLATGNEMAPTAGGGCHADPWISPPDADITKDATVLIIGTGLTMIDYVLSLLLHGHTGQIVAVSRRGLMPHVHKRIDPVKIDAADVPFGVNLLSLFRWFRGRIDRNAEENGDWRSVIDGIRPHVQKIWADLPLSSKRRFLEHVRAWWDVHRHRMAPEVAMRIASVQASGQLKVIAGKLLNVAADGAGARVSLRRRGQEDAEIISVQKIVECKGIVTNPLQTSNPAMRSLFDQCLARPDPLHIGIDVNTDCAVLNGGGVPSKRIFAVGPLTRAAFWEIVAVPDIRVQCAALASRLLQA
jgi:uncharacterized NAD(P)/FAD-binding protein YdhS